MNNVGAMHTYPQRFHDAEGGMEKMTQIMVIDKFIKRLNLLAKTSIENAKNLKFLFLF